MKFDDNDDSIVSYFVTHIKKKNTNFMIECSLPIFGWFSFMSNHVKSLCSPGKKHKVPTFSASHGIPWLSNVPPPRTHLASRTSLRRSFCGRSGRSGRSWLEIRVGNVNPGLEVIFQWVNPLYMANIWVMMVNIWLMMMVNIWLMMVNDG